MRPGGSGERDGVARVCAQLEVTRAAPTTERRASRAWDGFEFCYECDGSKLCPEHPHPYCKGWCHVCGGAGQWPLDPSTRYFAPAAPQINLEYLAKTRARR